MECPCCGDTLEMGWYVDYDGERQLVCEACVESAFDRCAHCSEWVHDEFQFVTQLGEILCEGCYQYTADYTRDRRLEAMGL